MELLDHQLDILDRIYANRFLYIKSPRGLGISTTLQGFALTEALTNGKSIIVFTHSQMFRYWMDFIKSHTFDEEILNYKRDYVSFRSEGTIILKPISSSYGICGYRNEIIIIDDVPLSRINDKLIFSIIPTLNNDSNDSHFIISGGGHPTIDLGRFGFHIMDLDDELGIFKPINKRTFIKW